MNERQPLRVLHCVGSMDPGGVETWLVNVLRHSDPAEEQLGFCCLSGRPGRYAPIVEALGGEVHPCRLTANLVSFNSRFAAILREGRYDIVHSHVHGFSGYVLWRARVAGVKGRVAHSHTAVAADGRRPGVAPQRAIRRAYGFWMHRMLVKNATACVAASSEAGGALFGSSGSRALQFDIVRCGIDVERFLAQVPSRESVRTSLGLAEDAVVIGHVGSFREEKNHRFLVEIARRVATIEPRSRFLLVGEGALRRGVEEAVSRAGLGSRFVFAGLRDDVPGLLGAMDVFLMPSTHEGLPVAGLEAQAAGLPVVFSDGVTPEAAVLPEMVQRLPLSLSPEVWAAAVLRAVALPVPPPEVRREAFARGGFSVAESAAQLAALYRAVLARASGG